MERVSLDQRHMVADGMMAVFKKIWVDAWSARMEYILNYTILALLEADGSTLLGINRMMAEKEYRKTVVDQVTDPEVKAFWISEVCEIRRQVCAGGNGGHSKQDWPVCLLTRSSVTLWAR